MRRIAGHISGYDGDEFETEHVSHLRVLVTHARQFYRRWRCADDLSRLAEHVGGEKWAKRRFARHYQIHFAPRRFEPLTLLEIGIGGYDDPARGGRSLRLWKAYFPNARIFGLDVFEKREHEEARVRTFVGSQEDESVLRRVHREAGRLDIVIDDGSHINAHVISSFRILFPLLSQNGLYVIEDTQTAYWPEYGGAPAAAGVATSMNFLKQLADGLNHREFPDRKRDHTPDYLEQNIVALHFYHNIAFIQKGLNDEPSNVLDR